MIPHKEQALQRAVESGRMTFLLTIPPPFHFQQVTDSKGFHFFSSLKYLAIKNII